MTADQSGADRLHPEIRSLANDLLPMFRKFVVGKYAIALGGSLAKGIGDAHSDVDIYVFAEDIAPLEERKRLVNDASGGKGEVYVDDEFRTAWWGAIADFDFRGRRIESTARSVDRVDKVVSDCLAGIIESVPTVWNPHGFYNHVYLSDVSSALPLDDPYGILAGWQERIAAYPPLLKKAIVARHMFGAGYWLDNFHYTSAINRGDIIYTSGIVQGSLHHLVQVLFALNETYYVGDKKNLEAVEGMPIKPGGFREKVAILLAASPDPAVLERQREVLKSLVAEVKRHI